MILMSIRQDIQSAMKDAMINKDAEKLSTLRMMWTAVRNTEIDKKGELNDEETQSVIARFQKQLQDGLKDFQTAGRTDLIEKSEKELAIVSGFLPTPLSEEEIQKIIEESAKEIPAIDAGKLMGAVMKKVKGRADGNVVRQLLERFLKKS